MSDWHALDGSTKKEMIKVAFHIPIPDINNEVDIKYRDALMASEPFTESSAPNVAGDELTELQTAEKLEVVRSVYFNANLAKPQKVAVIDARYTALVSEVQSEVQNKYIYWGYAHDVS